MSVFRGFLMMEMLKFRIFWEHFLGFNRVSLALALLIAGYRICLQLAFPLPLTASDEWLRETESKKNGLEILAWLIG